jgi:hypothetical protein
MENFGIKLLKGYNDGKLILNVNETTHYMANGQLEKTIVLLIKCIALYISNSQMFSRIFRERLISLISQ